MQSIRLSLRAGPTHEQPAPVWGGYPATSSESIPRPAVCVPHAANLSPPRVHLRSPVVQSVPVVPGHAFRQCSFPVTAAGVVNSAVLPRPARKPDSFRERTMPERNRPRLEWAGEWMQFRTTAACQQMGAAVCCPKGHVMMAHVSHELWTRSYAATCDECQNFISARDASYHCKECRRTICMNCATKQRELSCNTRRPNAETEGPPVQGLGSGALAMMAGDILFVGPDVWGIHHVILCRSRMNPAEAYIKDKVIKHHPKTMTQDILCCQTIESTRPLHGPNCEWYPALSVFVRWHTTGELEQLGDIGEGTRTFNINTELVPVKSLLHPFRPNVAGLTFDSKLFEAATGVCAAESRKWSKMTAIRALSAKRTAINQANFGDAKLREDLMQELRKRWLKKPICSSVAIQVWQKYIEMLFSGSPESTDLAAQHILRWMPVYSDQTTPSMLMKVLSQCGWMLLGNSGSPLSDDTTSTL